MKIKVCGVLVVATMMTACTNANDGITIPKVPFGTNSTQPSQTATQATNATAYQAFDLPTAISIAEAKTGGVAVNLQVYYAHDTTPAAYEIETITTTHEYTVQLDARTGDVLSIEPEYDMNVLPAVKLRLKDALIIAQKAHQGQVHEIELEREMTGSYYEVKIHGDHPYELHIDANSGRIIQNRVDYDD